MKLNSWGFMPEKAATVKEKLGVSLFLETMLEHRRAQEGIKLRLPALAFGLWRCELFHVKHFYFETVAYWYLPGRVYCATGAGDPPKNPPPSP